MLRRVSSEPLVRFVALGALVFALDRALPAPASGAPPSLVVADDFVAGLRARAAARGEGTVPSDAVLVHDYVREEVLFREAIARGLLDTDPIARRRLVAATELVLAAEVEIPEPSEAELSDFLAAHPDDFVRPARTTLEHVFFARGEDASTRANAARVALEGGASPEALGDAFLSGRRVGPATDARLDAVFGVGFAATTASLEPGRWAGPFAGALGEHLVRIEAREPRTSPTLDEVRDAVVRAWTDAARSAAVEREIDRLVAAVEVVRTGDPE